MNNLTDFARELKKDTPKKCHTCEFLIATFENNAWSIHCSEPICNQKT